MHPGARLRSRRWPLARYAEVARALRGAGWQVALTGSDAERALTRELRQRAGLALPDLCGATTLGSLAALLRASRLLVCNDTGVSHLAAAMGARSVVVACGSDARRWAPRDSRRHVVLAAPVPCRPCAYESCPIGHPRAAGHGGRRAGAGAGAIGAGAAMTQSRMPRGRRLRILTWHVHGNYLYALGQVPHDFVIPVLPGNPAGYGALGSRIPWGTTSSRCRRPRCATSAWTASCTSRARTWRMPACCWTTRSARCPAPTWSTIRRNRIPPTPAIRFTTRAACWST
ncbi:glycosyltransferase family 9 protein [Achromobacter xylosoxidans]